MCETMPIAAGTIAPEDRTLAMWTHLSGLAGYIVPLGGILAPIVILVIKRDNCLITAIARQATLLNITIFLSVAVYAVLALTVILLPLVILAWIVLWFAAIAVPIVGAVRALTGHYYRYPIIGFQP